MSWLARWKSKKIKIAWQYTTNGVLWRLIPSSDGHFIIEDRDVEKKSVAFTCLDHQTGRVLWRDVQFNEKWWITVDTIYRDVLFLHEYASPDMPEQKKIFAVDVHSSNVRWSNDEMKLLFVHDEHVYACQDGLTDRRFYELDLSNGQVMREIDDHVVNAARNITWKDTAENLQFPKVYFPESARESLKRSVDHVTAKARSVTFIEYLEDGNNDVVGFYEDIGVTPMQQTLRQHIAIVVSDVNKIVYSDIINESVSMAVPETFFTIGSVIYYIKNKKTLTALHLSVD